MNSAGPPDSSRHRSAQPPQRAFQAHIFTLHASLDGVEGNQLPIAIEEVCAVPKKFRKKAAWFAGNDGIAIVSASTEVFGDLESADTAVMRVRVRWPGRWEEDEDGNKVPTFKARRITVTD